jgi:endo-1,4-beta-D-glucanase Y
MIRSILFITLCLLLQVSSGQNNRPFPQQLSFSGCIKPNHVTQASMNTSVQNYYNYWKGLYLKPAVYTTNAYFIQGENTGGGASDKGTSEGHGYGMIITALMAGYDANAKTYYDGLYKFYNNHRSSIDNNLMGWLIDANETGSGEYSSATDGDLDIAYSLLLAHYQWGSAGTINYLSEAQRMINAIKASNINSSGRTNLGDWDNNAYNTRPSDWMFAHFHAFACATSDNSWNTVASTLTTVMNAIQTNYSSTTGLLPDFVVGNTPQPAAPDFLEGPNDGRYYYNACRAPMRIVMDYAHFGTTSAKTAVNKIVTWAKGSTVTNGNPANFRAGYALNGTNITGNNYQSAVFIAPIVAAATCDAAHQAYLNTGWDVIKTMEEDYFSDTYNLMAMLYISGNWWVPSNCITLDLQEQNWAGKETEKISTWETSLSDNSLSVHFQGSGHGTIELMTLSGSIVFSELLQREQYREISTEKFPAGMYLLRGTSVDGIWCKRLVLE